MTTPHSDAFARLLAAYRSPFALAGVAADTPLLLGLSGGADSRLLLHLVASECRQTGAPLHLAHVHHGIRGKEADRDESFCRDLADQYCLPFHVLHADVPALARERGESLETTARQVRYEFFSLVMHEQDIPLLLTAHNADDNLETVLFHLVRGCGLPGLGGIAPVRCLDAPGQTVVRPLLLCSKADIVTACREQALAFVTDSTNEDTAYTRNFLRARVLPALGEVIPHPEQQVVRGSVTLREDEQCLGQLAAHLLAEASVETGLLRAALAKAHPAIAKRALRDWAFAMSGQTLTTCHLDAMLQLCAPTSTSKRLCVPGGVVVAERECLRWQDMTDESGVPTPFEFPFSERTTERPELGFSLCVNRICLGQHQTVTQNDKNVYNPFIRDTLMFGTIVGYTQAQDTSLVWRSRRPGDTILFRGVNRKLRKLQNEMGIPPAMRDRLPLLCLGDTVLWAPFIGPRDGAFSPVNQDSSAAYRLTVEWHTSMTDNPKEDIL